MGTDYTDTAEHFNAMHSQMPLLIDTVVRLSEYTRKTFAIEAADPSFFQDLHTRR
jgi:hypothetical protein